MATYCLSYIIAGPSNTAVNTKDKCPYLHGPYVLNGNYVSSIHENEVAFKCILKGCLHVKSLDFFLSTMIFKLYISSE